jgi:hypothetical protein
MKVPRRMASYKATFLTNYAVDSTIRLRRAPTLKLACLGRTGVTIG